MAAQRESAALSEDHLADFKAGEPEPTTKAANCSLHGAYITRHLHARVWSRCPGCATDISRQREEEAVRQEEHRRTQYRRAFMINSGIVGRFETATFETFQAKTPAQREVLSACREFAESATDTSGAGLILIGPPGTGKSHLCAAIVRYVIETQVTPSAIVTSRDLVRSLRATWNKGNDESEGEVIERFGRNYTVLALDEVGASFGSESEQVQLLDVIDLRYRLRKPTVVASNLDLLGLQEAIGERAFDRLREGARVLICKWPSHRGQA